tara:strand:+ start:1072 stop:3192 length:2121 start_codon:yes stop_codon:yes gene_type:complete
MGYDILTPAQVSGLDLRFGYLSDGQVNNYLGVQPIQYNGGEKFRSNMPTVSGIEAAQYFLDRVAETHCGSGASWSNACGSYTPSLAPPYSIAGSPTNDMGFWERFKNNIIGVGNQIGRDLSYQPWSNHANNPRWSGQNYNCSGDNALEGYHPLPEGMFTYGALQKDDFNTFISATSTKSAPSFYQLPTIGFRREVIVSGVSAGATKRFDFLGGAEMSGTCTAISGSLLALNYGYTIDLEGGGTYVTPSSIVTGASISGVPSSAMGNSLTFDGPYYHVYEHEYYSYSGEFNLWPAYQYLLTGEGSGAVIGMSSDAMVEEEETIGTTSLYDKGLGASSHDIVASLVGRQDPDAAFYVNKTNRNRTPWRIKGSGVVEHVIDFIASYYGGHQVGCFPLTSKLGNRSFGQLMGTATTGDAQFLLGPYDPDVNHKQKYSQFAANINRGAFKDNGHDPSDCIFGGKYYLHGREFVDAQDLVTYIQTQAFADLATIDPGDALLNSGNVFNGVGFYPSGYINNDQNPTLLQVPVPLGCGGSGGKFFAMGFRYDFAAISGQLYDLTKSISYQIPAYHRYRGKASGIQVDYATKSVAGAPYSYTCSATHAVSNPRPYETPWSAWIYSKIQPGNVWLDPYRMFNTFSPFWAYSAGMGDQSKVNLPYVYEDGGMSVNSSSAEPHALSFGTYPLWGNVGTNLPLQLYSGEIPSYIWYGTI